MCDFNNLVLSNKIEQIHNSSGTVSGPKDFPKYNSVNKTTLFWGMYKDEDFKKCIYHKGTKIIYWHYNDCNPNYRNRRHCVKSLMKLDNVVHWCNLDSAFFLNYYKIKYTIILDSWHNSYHLFKKNNTLAEDYHKKMQENKINLVKKETKNIKKLYYNNIGEFVKNNFYDLDKFNDEIRGKKIIIVGPAPYLGDYNLGKFIDSFDIVVRVNKGHQMTVEPNKYGSRTDILFHCVSQIYENGGEVNNDLIRDKKIKKIFCAYPYLYSNDDSSFKGGRKLAGGNISIYQEFIKKKLQIPQVMIDKNYYLNLEKKIQTRPNTGFIAIDHLSRYTDKLYVIGFTFFKGGYNKLYRSTIDGKKTNLEEVVINRMRGTHDVDKQMIYFNNFLLNKIYIDSYFKKLFENNFSNFNEQYFCLNCLNKKTLKYTNSKKKKVKKEEIRKENVIKQEVKLKEIKQEAFKQEEVKSEEVKSEEAKQEEAKQEEVKLENKINKLSCQLNANFITKNINYKIILRPKSLLNSFNKHSFITKYPKNNMYEMAIKNTYYLKISDKYIEKIMCDILNVLSSQNKEFIYEIISNPNYLNLHYKNLFLDEKQFYNFKEFIIKYIYKSFSKQNCLSLTNLPINPSNSSKGN